MLTVTIKTPTETVHVEVPPTAPQTTATILTAVQKALETVNIKN